MTKNATIQIRPMKVAKDFWSNELIPFFKNVIGHDWHRKASRSIKPEKGTMLVRFRKMGKQTRKRLMGALKQFVSDFSWVSLTPSKGIAVLRFNF